MKMIREPEFCAHQEPFCVVGYPFQTAPDMSLVERGAYWQGLKFPPFDAAEFEKIGSDGAEIGVWTHDGAHDLYVFGYVVSETGYVPETMRAVTIPGGEFLIFRAPEHKNTQELGENMRATWRYASEQWLPASDYVSDLDRLAFEYYLGSNAMVYVPVKRKA